MTSSNIILYRLSPHRESKTAIDTQFEMGFAPLALRYSQYHTKVWKRRGSQQLTWIGLWFLMSGNHSLNILVMVWPT